MEFEEKRSHRLFQDLTGNSYHQLTALGYAGKIKGASWWYFSCSCGNIKKIRGTSVKTGATKSCGCLVGDPIKGIRGTPEKRSFNAMRARCNAKSHEGYKNYGGKGVQFLYNCVEELVADIGTRPKGCMLVRLDKKGHFEKGNCMWSPRLGRHSSKEHLMVTIRGITRHYSRWSSKQVSALKIYRRITESKWPQAAAVFWFGPAEGRSNNYKIIAGAHVSGKSIDELARSVDLDYPIS